MSKVNKKIQSLQPSATLSIKAKTIEMKAAGKKVINLAGGEPDLDTPDFIKTAATEALKAGKTKYTPVPGIAELRDKIAEFVGTRSGITAKAENVVVTNGGKQAIHEVLSVILEAGDEVIIPAPFWVSYPDQVELSSGTPVIVKTSADSRYKITPEDFKQAITAQTKLLIINSPSNPTGAMYSKSDLVELIKVAKEHQIMILSDEVYDQIILGEQKFHSTAALAGDYADNIITINAFSKCFSMTGWRIGYLVADTEIAKAVAKYQSQTTSNVNTPTQYAAMAAISQPTDFQQKLNENFVRRLNRVDSLISEIPGLEIPFLPEGAFYVFIRIDELISMQTKIQNSADFSTYLLEEAGVATVPGVAFGDDTSFRTSLCLPDDVLEEAFGAIKVAVERLIG